MINLIQKVVLLPLESILRFVSLIPVPFLSFSFEWMNGVDTISQHRTIAHEY